MDFGGDTTVYNIADQYMLGPSLLVAPVTEYKARERHVYLPAGQGWYDLYSGKFSEGRQYINADAPYHRMPVFVKEGSILPLGPDLQYTGERAADTITLFVYTGRDADFTLYEDEGTNYNYEKGGFAVIPLHYDEAAGTLTIGRREGAFEGMLHKRIFRVEWVQPAYARPIDGDTRSAILLTYDGKAKSIGKP
jgi:alpha-D-xyloside xylohydrolase